MSWVAPSPVGSGVAAGGGDGSGCLREAVLAGPVSGVLVEDGLRAGLLTDLVGGNTVGVALAQAGHVDGRRRVLTGMVTVLTLRPGVLAPGAPVPTASAWSQARTRLHGDVLGTLFAATAGAGNDAGAPGVTWLGLELTVFDGTVVDLAATGAHLAWRVKNGAKSLPAKIIEVLADGSQLVRLRESDSMCYARRRATGDATLARLPDTIARLVEFTLAVTDGRGRTRTSRFRILTTLLDHHTHPARQIAALYAERWQAEVVYYRIKVTLRGPGVRLRGQTPALARQEIWGLLVVYNALCNLTTRTAVALGVDPDEISFVAVLRLTRTHFGADTGCRNCGHRPADPVDALVTAIAAHPRNRTGRQRTSPRTKAQRRTEHTRDVSYIIEIVPSNLPKTE